MMKPGTGALPNFRPYKDGMENGEAVTLEGHHDLFNRAQGLR